MLPMHDRPALIDRARVVGRLLESVPAPVTAVEDYPGPTTSEIETARARGAPSETAVA